MYEDFVKKVYESLHPRSIFDSTYDARTNEFMNNWKKFINSKDEILKKLDSLLMTIKSHYSGLACEICRPQAFENIQGQTMTSVEIPLNLKNLRTTIQIIIDTISLLNDHRTLYAVMDKLEYDPSNEVKSLENRMSALDQEKLGDVYSKHLMQEDVRNYFIVPSNTLLDTYKDRLESLKSTSDLKSFNADPITLTILVRESFVIYNLYWSLIVNLYRTSVQVLLYRFDVNSRIEIPKGLRHSFNFGQCLNSDEADEKFSFVFSPIVDGYGFDLTSNQLNQRYLDPKFTQKLVV